MITFFRNDARHFQLVFLSLFLIYGTIFLQWHIETAKFLSIGVGAIAIHALLVFLNKAKWIDLKSTMITALGLCLLLKTSSVTPGIVAISAAILSKTVLRYKGSHHFNPANFGLLIAVIFCQDAWISPGQWGSTWVLVCFLTVCALMVLIKVGRMDTSLTFILTLFGLEFIRQVIFLNWSMDVLVHQFTNGSLLLFTFFMITDPKTTPKHTTARILWALILGVISFAIMELMYLPSAPLWVLLFSPPLTIFLNHIFPARPFQWATNS